MKVDVIDPPARRSALILRTMHHNNLQLTTQARNQNNTGAGVAVVEGDDGQDRCVCDGRSEGEREGGMRGRSGRIGRTRGQHAGRAPLTPRSARCRFTARAVFLDSRASGRLRAQHPHGSPIAAAAEAAARDYVVSGRMGGGDVSGEVQGMRGDGRRGREDERCEDVMCRWCE